MCYEERLAVPRLWHVWAVLCAGVFGSYFTVYTDSAGIRVSVYAGMFAGMEVALWVLGRARLTVTEETVTAAGRVLPRDGVREVAVCSDIRTVLAPGVYAVTRPWIRTGAWIRTVSDAWVVSCRHPDEFVAAMDVSGRALTSTDNG
ncbi:DUF3093 family protein [Protofrankia symbiont of Coriaria ruscifolia]|uniref:Uncharacterized protein n=1 Tax=Candidatus Protofrankia californiensis TaxID=1839754 RepID=A0A1C3NY48_9ACTN|nr:DUF3093 family protein [Protofrankia symbiont of Coriaria ruscifolia]SBW22474.1 hypothetical protein FDG2_2689 [Candidatus Protofrankia californiensis]